MKTTKGLALIIAIVLIVSCKKDTKTTAISPATENYSSVNDFFLKNGVAMQTYTINGSAGGSFTSPQGTTVTIPANAFLTQTSVPVTANVTIQFKDIYKKSDMLLSNIPTITTTGNPLKSGGEFFIKAVYNNSALVLASGKKISVTQPASLTGGLDTINIQKPFVGFDTSTVITWNQSNLDSVKHFASQYVYSLYQFHVPADSGSWCNSDNATFFSAYPQTTLSLIPNDNTGIYGTQTFLVFKTINTMIHVYYYSPIYPYHFAPTGLQCTIVAVGIKNGSLYSSFVPITISSNLSVNFTLSPTTTSSFVSQLQALN